ncbi:MAG: type I DNA topoisomerase [Patescibacteria group bacterium]|nr:type I DNA topoisomerase [Patescibacteria group bacterium]
MDLIIVESPTKAKKIGTFVGKEYTVESSYGHVRDLPKSKLGIDVKHDFEPTYLIPKKAEPVVDNLKKLAKKADRVILATDEDREGEAIAWHLVEALGLDGNKEQGARSKETQRIAFHEITKDAIIEALKNPRAIDENLVDAQQARRVLDRLVGYELSPFLWRKVRYGLSAGRVQSVAVRLVVERERAIQAFKKEEYWSIEGIFNGQGTRDKGQGTFPATLNSINGKALGKMDIENETEARRIVDGLDGAEYRVSEITTRDVRRNPSAPFTTSTLQQEAARKLGYSAKQTMMIAQKLYENGHITYMRTDSVNLAESALRQAQQVIASEFGKEYALAEPRRYATKSKGAQEAHEAIRPTDLAVTSSKGIHGVAGAGKLYDLIWKRTIASQMKEALLEQTAVDIVAEMTNDKLPMTSATFRANGQVVKFDGFIRAYTEGRDEGEGDDQLDGKLPKLEKGDALKSEEIKPVQHFTEPPPRYTDATLVKALEAEGIGRPSTYAPTLSTIQERGYVEKIEKKYQPTEIGFLVNDILVEHFPEIVDLKFTSHVEEELDEIAEGKLKWTDVCREFYGPFKAELKEKEATVEKQVEISNVPCPHCGKPMIIKFGRMGKFLACPEPGVKVTLPMPEEAAEIKALEEKTKDERCPICGKPMKVKRGRFGYFLSCVDYPNCKGISKIWDKTGFKCPNCRARLAARGGERSGEAASRTIDRPSSPSGQPDSLNLVGDVVLKKSRGRGRPFYACNRWPDCTFLMGKKPETEEQLQEAYQEWLKNPPKPKEKTAARKSK